MAVDRNKRKGGKSKSRSKGARWTPCPSPELFLQLSVLSASGTSPSRIKYPWKDGLLFSIVLNNRHNQQIRHIHYTYSNTNTKHWPSVGQWHTPGEVAHNGRWKPWHSIRPFLQKTQHSGIDCWNWHFLSSSEKSETKNWSCIQLHKTLHQACLNIFKSSVFQFSNSFCSSVLKELSFSMAQT